MSEATVEALIGTVPDGLDVVRILMRLVAAVLLGAVIGAQREIEHKPAGLRTHALVALAAAVFVMVPLEAGMLVEDLSRVVQGVATGIGFIGAGAILKLRQNREIHGLTTAATVWMATAIGIAVGVGQVLFAALAVAITWIVLSVFVRLDDWLAAKHQRQRQPPPGGHD